MTRTDFWSISIGLLFSLLMQSHLNAQLSDAVQQVLLDPLSVTRIPVSMNGPTTVRFPSPISDMEGALISTDPGSFAPFLLSFRPGSAFFSVRALLPNTNTSLNVVWKNQTYVLELDESKTPWLSVIFTESPSVAASEHHRPVTPSRLLGLLDTARAYPLLRTQHPEAVAGVQQARPNTLNDYGDYTIKTEEVFRFDDADTLVFQIAVSNKTAQAMRYLPQSLMVQAGNRVFYQSITDGNGQIPPQSTVPIYFAITGTADGKRNDLSPRNDFLVLLQRLDPSQPIASRPNDAVLNQSNSGEQATKQLPDAQPQIGSATPSATTRSVLDRVTPFYPQVTVPATQTYYSPPTTPAWTAPQVAQPVVQTRPVYYSAPPTYYSAPATVYYYPPVPVYYSQPAPRVGYLRFGFGYGR